MDKIRFLPSAALLSALLLAGCAHQPSAPSAETPQTDALEISLPTLKLEGVTHRAVVTGPNPPTTVKAQPDIYRGDLPSVEVIRTGRYQLVATQALLGQRHLLEQTVEVRIPAAMNASVEDALEHALRDTGVSLCPAPGPAQRMLYRMPLPASHYRLGPMALREALQVLGGEAWELELDPVAREVCYQVRDIRYVPEPGEGGEVIAEVRDE